MHRTHWLTRLAGGLTTALAVALALAAALIGTPAAAARAAITSAASVIGYVYVNDNTAGANTVAGFAQHADGQLTPLSGSPFAAGGAGTGASFGSQGALQLSADRSFVLAVDAGSSQISVLSVHGDGSLTQVSGSPVAAGGVKPVSLAVHGHLVYVANAGSSTEQPNYMGFTLDAGGALAPLAGSTVALPRGAQPGDVLFNGTGTRLVGVRVATSVIDSFTVGTDGLLTAAPGSPFAAPAAGPFGSKFSPTNPAQLFVSNAHAGANNGTVSAFHDGHDGVLTSIGASPYPDFQTAPCWVAITPNGRYLFTVNTASASVSRYAIAEGGALTLLGSTALNDGVGLSPFDLRVDPAGQFAYVVDSGRGAVSELVVHGGELTELTSSPVALPAGARPFGIVVVQG
jgi:6-phosphogluconolactonase (cycloisomerase 2 family)